MRTSKKNERRSDFPNAPLISREATSQPNKMDHLFCGAPGDFFSVEKSLCFVEEGTNNEKKISAVT